tara:strand:+ start:86 stop:625 length:540 start_codon:yes stop_codon:yes gene_type:complete
MDINNNNLSNEWNLWLHSPNDNDWSMSSFKNIYTIKSIFDIIKLQEGMHKKIYENYMIFIMKDKIKPIWEDKENKEGGCFSYKILNSNIYEYSKKIIYYIIGNTILDNELILNNINGISISPKKHFCIFKIWIKDIKILNSELKLNIISDIEMDDVFNVYKKLNVEMNKIIYKSHNLLY